MVRRGWSRGLFDAAFLALLVILVGPPLALVAVVHERAGARLPLPAEALLVPVYACVFLVALILLLGVARHLVPRLEPGVHAFPGSRQALAWLLHFGLQRVAHLPLWGHLIFAFASLRWLLLRALGARVAFDIDTSIDAAVLDASLVEIGPGCMLGAGTALSCHFVENDTLRLAPVRLGAGVQVLAGVFVSPGVTVGDDAVLGPGSRLLPHVEIGARARLGMACVLHQNATVGAGAVLGHHVIVEMDAVIGEGAVVLMGARVPKGTKVAAGSRFP